MIKPTIGIIGQGSFGSFIAKKLGGKLETRTYEKGDDAEALRSVASCDYLMLAVPLGAYREVLEMLVPVLPPITTLIDICSVKMAAVAAIREVLPDQLLVATHPLFGPESAADGLAGHTLVLCPELSDPQQYQRVSALGQVLGMRVIRMSADDHDREMATVQGLTFFVARAIGQFGVGSQILSTPSFRKLLDLAELDTHHSSELFMTIQNGNVYTEEVRQRFINIVGELDDSIVRESAS